MSGTTIFAQDTVREPEFIGEALILSPDGTLTPLEKSTIVERERQTTYKVITGVGSDKTQILIDGRTARVQISRNDDSKLIVRAVDNNTDPLSFISVFRLKTSEKRRIAEIASKNMFGSSTNNRFDFLPFSASKYGTSSYILTLEEKPAGEYSIIVRNPNALNQSATIVSAFAIK
ncbi:MAG: hypothetical protein LBV41_01200 [Cytophagaceae bacterium]|nr:hypothetical protein [Cytophagaceae bacterium]